MKILSTQVLSTSYSRPKTELLAHRGSDMGEFTVDEELEGEIVPYKTDVDGNRTL